MAKEETLASIRSLRMRSIKARRLLKRFFEILDAQEYNHSGMGDTLFHPTYIHMDEKLKVTISSCRCMRVVELDQILRELKEWSK